MPKMGSAAEEEAKQTQSEEVSGPPVSGKYYM